VSSGYDRRKIGEFAGTELEVDAMSVEVFNDVYRDLIKDATDYANAKEAEGKAARAEQAKKVAEAKNEYVRKLEDERAKADDVSFD